MTSYIFRKATTNDIPFLADIVVNAEKGNSDKFSLSELLNISESRVRELIISMFEENVDGCEFSVQSYLLCELEGKPIAGFAGWIECYKEPIPSKVLKSNLMAFTFGASAIQTLLSKKEIINDLSIERTPLTFQLEYLYVSEMHRGKQIADLIISKHINNAIEEYSDLKYAQVQVFKNNYSAINVYTRNNFEIESEYKSDHKEVLSYLPFDSKYRMQRKIVK